MRQTATKVAAILLGYLPAEERTFDTVLILSQRLMRYYEEGFAAVLPGARQPATRSLRDDIPWDGPSTASSAKTERRAVGSPPRHPPLGLPGAPERQLDRDAVPLPPPVPAPLPVRGEGAPRRGDGARLLLPRDAGVELPDQDRVTRRTSPILDALQYLGDVAIPKVIEESGGEDWIKWDDGSDRDAAHQTAERVTSAYYTTVVPRIQPTSVEEKFSLVIPGVEVPVIGYMDTAGRRPCLGHEDGQAGIDQGEALLAASGAAVHDGDEEADRVPLDQPSLVPEDRDGPGVRPDDRARPH